MPWLKLKLRANQDQAQSLADALEEWGAISVTMQDAGDEPVFDTYWEQSPLWSQVQITGLFPENTDAHAILAQTREHLGLAENPPHEIERLDDEDWENSWKTGYKPLQVGRGLWVVPSWYAAPEPNAVNIILDPGLAFGTGDHPTTSLCLEWLSEQALAGKTLLDYGCGSGILSIAALKLGAAQAHAVDIDPQALTVTQRNAAFNGIQTGLDVMLPSALPKTLQADIVVANILFGTLIELAEEIKAHVRPGGWLVLSGLLGEEQATGVRPHYEPPFVFTLREKQNWMRLAGRKITETV
jgi:ribosomal protein L11 methyltransferase